MTRVYLAGPMTGLPEKNYPTFARVAAKLRAIGYDVVSPAELNPDPATTWNEAMRRDIPALCTCEAIALLPGWERSKGTRGELEVARLLQMPEIYLTQENT